MCNAVDQKGAGGRGIQRNGTSYLSFPEDGCHPDEGERRPSGRAELSRGLCAALFKAASAVRSWKRRAERVVDDGWGGRQRCSAELCALCKTFSNLPYEIAQRVHPEAWKESRVLVIGRKYTQK